MENNNYAVVQIIQNFLGAPKNEFDALSKKQWQFNCPSSKCKHDSDKFNLEYQSEKHVFKCWKCGYRGYVNSLVSEYGTPEDSIRLNIMLPIDHLKNNRETFKRIKTDHNLATCKLPEGYIPLGKKRNTSLYRLAWDYLINIRKVSPGFIDKYEIGYTETGNRKFRIIIPSKNSIGKFNYYEARSYMKDPKIPYIKPSSDEVKKTDIIFNEYFINWNLPIFLVEGVFDMFRLPNAIPVLGKEISELLIDELLKYKPIIFLCFDPDAMDTTTEYYEKLSSLGLNVYYIDLTGYNKDISKIYEDHGKKEVAKAVMNFKRLDLEAQVIKKLKDEKRENKK